MQCKLCKLCKIILMNHREAFCINAGKNSGLVFFPAFIQKQSIVHFDVYTFLRKNALDVTRFV